jgi:hypothetical protein
MIIQFMIAIVILLLTIAVTTDCYFTIEIVIIITTEVVIVITVGIHITVVECIYMSFLALRNLGL